ncbi:MULTISPECIES: bifunctional UDP-sugar hydrolase/5'-nucleotidase [unclassified Spirosoma]|uniref:bifunctional metallophosphatase/5'-nucleotidase n=1 Tax=unclassified Spirosoma TaxID=2621999 RepID=UPI0009698FD8|nr:MULTISPECIES: metallophosphatase [unclassified Spirosoma]MBN8822052.1 metallophosphatase [Spirosoma sp.]OJW80458.1 MAG: metallophosphatase [Spirosoma sp. 48-14]
MDALASNRRQFLKLLGTAAVVGSVAPDVLASTGYRKPTSLTILHTNDVHSRLDPFPMDGSRNAGKGGVARRATLIQKIRQEQSNVLLFDAGDIFQGTPYFNLYKGEPEILAMNKLGYDAGTIGNHDFDGGIDNMVTQFGKASFPLLIANYDFKNTVMDGKTMPFKLFDKDGIRIGVFGLGIQPAGLIPKDAYKETKYLDPVEIGNDMAAQLRNDKKCDYVICLSHLGFKYNDATVSDNVLAGKSRNIDLIIGGHTHTFLDAPVAVNNMDGQPVWINQVGFAGINLGRIDLTFERGKAVSNSGTAVEVK